MKNNILRRKIAGFTLAELLIVITVTAILATIGFLSLSGYRKDAEVTKIQANLRSVYSAISTEAISTSRSPRYYVRHDSNMALTGGAVVVFDGFPIAIAGGEWDMPGTNYSAGNPHYEKLKLDSEKFRTSFGSIPWGTIGMLLRNLGIRAVSAETYVGNPMETLVGAADFTDSSGEKPRIRSYLQIGTLSSDQVSYVVGDYPEPPDETAVSGLIRDIQNPSWTGALVDGAPVGSPPPCTAGTVENFPVGQLESGQSQNVSRTVENGIVHAVAKCAYGVIRIESETVSCEENYARGAGYSCVRDTCSGTFPEHAESNGESGTSEWSFSESPGICKFRCSDGYSWSGGACRADCAIAVSADHLGKTYALDSVRTMSHGETFASSGTHAFWLAPANGTLRADFEFSCADGTASKTSSSASWACQENYVWNGDFSNPSCQAQTRTANCEAIPVSAEWNSASSIVQTWNGTAWTPSLSGAFSETASTASCVFRCVSWYQWNGSSCVATSCAAIKTAYPISNDGTYAIDPDGNWPVGAFTATCDMNTGTGGWLVLNDAMTDYTKWTNCVSGYGTVSASGLWQVAANNGGGVSGVHGGCGIIWRNEKKIPFRHLQIKSFSAPANASCGSVLFPNIKVNVFSADSIPTSFSTGNHYPWWEPEGTNYASKRSGSRSSGFPTSDLYDAGSSGTWAVHLWSGRYSSCWGAWSGIFMVR